MTSKRKSYYLEDKKWVIEWIVSEGDGIPTRAVKQFKLPPGTVHSWWNSREAVLNASASDLDSRRLIGAGRKGMILDYDDELVEAILYLRNAKERVTRQTVKDIAMGISERENIEDFKASDGWLTKFMEHNKFTFRRVTNLIALSDENLLQCSFDYMKYLQTMILKSQSQNTILMDEMAVYLEDPQRTTLAPIGSKHVLLKTTGFASMRITVVLAVRANGEKVTPLVILKGKDSGIEKNTGFG